MDKLRINKNTFPDVGEYVIGKVTSIDDYMTFNILEYKIDGIITWSQVSKKAIRGIKVGQTHIAEVINSEKDKGIVDLSMLNVNSEDKKRVSENYQKNKLVLSIVYEMSIATKIDIEQLNKEINWDTNTDDMTSYEYLSNACSDKNMLNHLEYSDKLYDTLQKHYKKESGKISKKIKIVCYSNNGVNGIIESLKKVEELGITVNFVSSPCYVLETNESSEFMEHALSILKQEITLHGGEMQVC